MAKRPKRKAGSRRATRKNSYERKPSRGKPTPTSRNDPEPEEVADYLVLKVLSVAPNLPAGTRKLPVDSAFEALVAALPTPVADEILHAEAAGELADDLGIPGDDHERRKEFSKRLKIALERFIRTSRLHREAPRGLHRKVRQRLEQIRSVSGKLETLLHKLIEGDSYPRSAGSPRLPESYALDLMKAYGRRLDGPDWLLNIDRSLLKLRRFVRIALQLLPDANEHIELRNLVFELKEIFETYTGRSASGVRLRPSPPFREFVSDVFEDINTWGNDYYQGTLRTSRTTLSIVIQRALTRIASVREIESGGPVAKQNRPKKK